MCIEDRDVGTTIGVEVDGRYIVEESHGFFDRSRENLPDGLFVFEFDFGFGGMDVDVDILGGHVEIDEVRHLFARRNHPFQRQHDSFIEVGMLHISAVDEEVLVGTFFASRFRFTHEAADFAH